MKFVLLTLNSPLLILSRSWVMIFPLLGLITPWILEHQLLIDVQENDRFIDLLENSHDVIIFANKNRKLVQVNVQFYNLLGYNKNDIENLTLHDIFSSEFQFHDTIKEDVWLTKNKTELIMDVRISNIVKSDEIIIIARDITETKQMYKSLKDTQDQLLHSQKMEIVGRFINSVIHDFNNLLQIIDWHIQILKLQQYGEEENFEAVDEAIRHSTQLINQLLEFSKSDKNLRLEIVNINKLIHDARILISKLEKQNIDVIFETSAEPLYIKANPSQINQVILNLIVNAYDAMPNGGTITIGARQERHSVDDVNYALITVSDTGEGMDKQTKKNLFEPFYTTKSHGTGLGLFTVSSIVEQNKGKISVESELGQGTTFKIYLPQEVNV